MASLLPPTSLPPSSHGQSVMSYPPPQAGPPASAPPPAFHQFNLPDRSQPPPGHPLPAVAPPPDTSYPPPGGSSQQQQPAWWGDALSNAKHVATSLGGNNVDQGSTSSSRHPSAYGNYSLYIFCILCNSVSDPDSGVSWIRIPNPDPCS